MPNTFNCICQGTAFRIFLNDKRNIICIHCVNCGESYNLIGADNEIKREEI